MAQARTFNRNRMEKLVDTIIARYDALSGEDRKKIIDFISSRPMTREEALRIQEFAQENGHEDIKTVADDSLRAQFDDLYEVIKEVEKDGRIADTYDLAVWLGLDRDASAFDILNKAHLYKRMGVKGYPRSIADAA